MSESKTMTMNRNVLLMICIIFLMIVMMYSCKKESAPAPLHYYEVGFKNETTDWRDSSFVVATSDTALISKIQAQLALPVAQRQLVSGRLIAGNGGYNKNSTHFFKWRLKENDWDLADVSIEISDGRPYNDVDINLSYWLNTVKRFSPWGSYIKKEITQP
jgi:hypothetical protein